MNHIKYIFQKIKYEPEGPWPNAITPMPWLPMVRVNFNHLRDANIPYPLGWLDFSYHFGRPSLVTKSK